MYLTPESPDAFLDYPPKRPTQPHTKTCEKCHGHGGWNLRINAYPLHNHPNTPENRHKFSHFRASCSNCWGYGYVPESQTCVHEYEMGANIGKCLHEWVCKKCKQVIQVDSSD